MSIREEAKLWYLNQMNIFQGIPEKDIMEIAKNIYHRHCSKKEILYTPFEPSNSIYILKQGEVTIYSSHQGKKIIIDVLKPGSIFGNIGFEAKGSNHYAEVTEKGLICTMSDEDFKKVIANKPEIMFRFIQEMSRKLSDYENRIKSSLYDAKEKIVHFLEVMEKKNERSFVKKLTGRAKKITHEVLANYAGISRETATRAIAQLKKEGKVCLTHEGVITLQCSARAK